MGSLVINDGCWDSLKISDKRNDNLVELKIDDRDMLINKSEAQQIVNHLTEQFKLNETK